MEDEYVLRSGHQIRGLAHPLRQHIVRLLANDAMTNKQLAVALNASPPRIHFHVRELLAAGLILLVEERPKGGVVEKYYRAVAANFRLGPELGALVRTDLVDATLQAASEVFAATDAPEKRPLPGTRVVQLSVNLDDTRFARLHALFDELDREVAALEAECEETAAQTIMIAYALLPLPTSRELADAEDENQS